MIAASEVARILGISRLELSTSAGKLEHFWPSGPEVMDCYPAWQFEESGVLGGLERVLKALARHDEWMKLAFLRAQPSFG